MKLKLLNKMLHTSKQFLDSKMLWIKQEGRPRLKSWRGFNSKSWRSFWRSFSRSTISRWRTSKLNGSSYRKFIFPLFFIIVKACHSWKRKRMTSLMNIKMVSDSPNLSRFFPTSSNIVRENPPLVKETRLRKIENLPRLFISLLELSCYYLPIERRWKLRL